MGNGDSIDAAATRASQYNTYFWFALAVVSFLISIGGIVIAVRQKRKTASGFDVVTTG